MKSFVKVFTLIGIGYGVYRLGKHLKMMHDDKPVLIGESKLVVPVYIYE